MTNSTSITQNTRPAAIMSRALLLIALLAGCDGKGPDFFGAELGDESMLPDIDRPRFTNFLPRRDIMGPVRATTLSFDFNDSPSTNGALVSGIETNPSVTMANGQSLAITRSADSYTGSLNIPDGPISLHLSGQDKARNAAVDTVRFQLKNTPPTVAFTMTPPATQQSSAASLDIWVRGTVNEPFLGTAIGAVYRPGADNTCGTADDSLVPQGTGAGQVSRNTFDYTMSVRENGTFALWYTAYNGVASGGTATTARYCHVIRVTDTAKNGLGIVDPNVMDRMVEASISWQSPPPTTGAVAGTVTMAGQGVPGVTVQLSASGVFRTVQTAANGSYRFDQVAPGSYTVFLSGIPSDVTCTPSIRTVGVSAGGTATADFTCSQQVQFNAIITGSWKHFVGFSMICWQVVTSPAQPNAAFTTSVSGPAVLSGSAQSGSLSASGTTSSSADIGAYGGYTVATTIAGRLFTGVINVDGGAGTCQ